MHVLSASEYGDCRRFHDFFFSFVAALGSFFCAVLSVVDDDVPFWLARNIYKQLIETLVDRIFFHLRKALYGLEVPWEPATILHNSCLWWRCGGCCAQAKSGPSLCWFVKFHQKIGEQNGRSEGFEFWYRYFQEIPKASRASLKRSLLLRDLRGQMDQPWCRCAAL